MSYILEALRRAEAERQRGAVPHLHAQPALAGDGDVANTGRRPWGRWLAAAVATLLLLAAMAWFLARDKAVAPPQSPAPAQGPLGGVTAPQVPHADGARPAAVAVPAVPAASIAPVAIAPVPLGMAASPPPMPAATPSPPTAVAVPAKLAASASPVARPPAPAVAPAAPAAVTIPTLAELSAAQRQGLPALTLGGIVHSPQAAQRLVILNGQVLHEGDRPAPELQVEQIRPRSVVLSFRGQAFELPQ